jgi:hypothetical protein
MRAKHIIGDFEGYFEGPRLFGSQIAFIAVASLGGYIQYYHLYMLGKQFMNFVVKY